MGTELAPYRGRLAPTPSGSLHLGHARTFWIAQERALARGGDLILRTEDLDPDRCRPQHADEMLEDLRWFGLKWQEGPDVGGPFGPYVQSQRRHLYAAQWRKLVELEAIYPSFHSRRDIAGALTAPHDDAGPGSEPEESGESIFPAALRPQSVRDAIAGIATSDAPVTNWRFRVPDGEVITFVDGRRGVVERTAGADFGDFLVWRKDGYPSYELAVVCDDHAMRITEVVRGEDLLTSTARQLLLYRVLGWEAPQFYHCRLLRDVKGRRLAKRTDAVSLQKLRLQGYSAESLRAEREWSG
jgi:glutamyl-tRNA synthetase